MNYFISDLHFGCVNEYDNKTLETDDLMVENCNKFVTQKDDLWILGDLGRQGSRKDNEYLVSKLALMKGRKHLIRGNHDSLKDDRICQQFVEICDYKRLRYSEGGFSYDVVLSHYPILMWDGQHSGSILLYGHVHSSPEWGHYEYALDGVNEYFRNETLRGRKDCPKAIAFNVGAMLPYMGWTPRTISDIEWGVAVDRQIT